MDLVYRVGVSCRNTYYRYLHHLHTCSDIVLDVSPCHGRAVSIPLTLVVLDWYLHLYA